MGMLLTPDDLVSRWNCSKSYIYLLSSSGKLRKIKIGHLIRFRIEDVEEFENRNTVEMREPFAI
jgi:excisionase family DNA binding protein